MARSSVRARLGSDGDQQRDDPGWRERRVGRLERDVAVVERTGGWINLAVWGIALGVMVYGAMNVMPLLIEHGVLWWTAPGLPLMVDLAMCIGLWGDRIMHQYGRRSGWVTALRWVAATMTLVLNIAGPLLGLDWVGLGIHACGPLLILVVAEAAGAFQRLFAEIVAELQGEIERQRSVLLPETAEAAAAGSSTDPMPAAGRELLAHHVRPRRDMRDDDRGGPVSHEPSLVGNDHGAGRYVAEIPLVRHSVDAERDAGSGAGLAGGSARRGETSEGGPTCVDVVSNGELSGSDTPPHGETTSPGETPTSRDETNDAEPRRDERRVDETRLRRARRDDGETAPQGETTSRDETPTSRDETADAGPRRDGTEALAQAETRWHATGPGSETAGQGRPRDGAPAPNRDGDVQSRMWAHFEACVSAGTPVNAADLDRAAGTNNYARRVVARWIEEGRITEQDRDDARVGRVTAPA